MKDGILKIIALFVILSLFSFMGYAFYAQDRDLKAREAYQLKVRQEFDERKRMAEQPRVIFSDEKTVIFVMGKYYFPLWSSKVESEFRVVTDDYRDAFYVIVKNQPVEK